MKDFSIRERRLAFWFGEVKPNVVNWGKDVKKNYIDDPIVRKDPLKTVLGVGMVGAEAVLRFPDMVWAGVVDQKKDAPTGFMGRTRQASGQLLTNVVTIHPLRALGNASELVFSFPWALDLADATIFNRDNTRSAVAKVMKEREPQLAMAA